MALFGPSLLQQVGRAIAVGAASGAGVVAGATLVSKIISALTPDASPLPAKRATGSSTMQFSVEIDDEALQKLVAAAGRNNP